MCSRCGLLLVAMLLWGCASDSEGKGTATEVDLKFISTPRDDLSAPADLIGLDDLGDQWLNDASLSETANSEHGSPRHPDHGGGHGELKTDTTTEPDINQEEDVITVEVSEEPCFFVPEVGEFEPILECYWDDPLEHPQFDDVVMAPVVANITDDNLDGLVNLEDIPDILFATYRRSEDGCCDSPSVLRVVGGSCSGGLTGASDDQQLLHEHFHISLPKLDNSAGLVVGDIDADGLIDIVGMTQDSGTVAFTGVVYQSLNPSTEEGVSPDWAVVGAPHAVAALTDGPLDDTRYVATSVPEQPIWFNFEWPVETAALATVRVIAYVRSVDGATEFTGLLRLGDQQLEGQVANTGFSPQFGRFAFDFPKNGFDDERMWTDDVVDNLVFGVVHQGSDTVEMQVTRLEVVVGNVTVKWVSDQPKGNNHVTAAQPALTDLDKDGIPEIVVGRVVLDGASGETRWKGDAGVGINSFLGPISVPADVNLDGFVEVIAGNSLYDHEGNTLWTYQYGNEGTGCKDGGLPCDGFNATGDFDGEPYGEIVTVREGVVYVIQHTGELLARIKVPHDDCSWNEGGPPTVADFDGDGQPEIGVAGADFYAVLDLECCKEFPVCEAVPDNAPQCDSAGVRWKVPNKDCSSRATGSSVFDFDGDGKAEVVYNDEDLFRIMSGPDGEVLFETPNNSHTRLEYALVVDCDNDGNAEIVMVENGNNTDPVPLQVWGDAHNNWVPTRRIWNQHAYHITNIQEDGLMPPADGQPNWLVFNNFRQNLPDYDPFSAADIIVSLLDPGTDFCPEKLLWSAQICNVGQLFVPGGVPAAFYNDQTGASLFCEEGSSTTKLLDPGECDVVHCLWTLPADVPPALKIGVCADGTDSLCVGPGKFNECNEDNNTDVRLFDGCW